MDSFNKVISFILGLVVVVVFVAVLMGRIKLGGKGFSLLKPSPSVTPTPVKVQSLTINPTGTVNKTGTATNSNYKAYTNTNGKASSAKTIPSTGVETLFVPSLLALATAGSFIRRSGKK